jgi:hypothetical protein
MIEIVRTHTGIALRASEGIPDTYMQTIWYAIHSYSFLLPFNAATTGAQFARLIREHSTAIRSVAIAAALELIDGGVAV